MPETLGRLQGWGSGEKPELFLCSSLSLPALSQRKVCNSMHQGGLAAAPDELLCLVAVQLFPDGHHISLDRLDALFGSFIGIIGMGNGFPGEFRHIDAGRHRLRIGQPL